MLTDWFSLSDINEHLSSHSLWALNFTILHNTRTNASTSWLTGSARVPSQKPFHRLQQARVFEESEHLSLMSEVKESWRWAKKLLDSSKAQSDSQRTPHMYTSLNITKMLNFTARVDHHSTGHETQRATLIGWTPQYFQSN